MRRGGGSGAWSVATTDTGRGLGMAMAPNSGAESTKERHSWVSSVDRGLSPLLPRGEEESGREGWGAHGRAAGCRARWLWSGRGGVVVFFLILIDRK